MKDKPNETIEKLKFNFNAPLSVKETSLVSPGAGQSESTPQNKHLHVKGVAIHETTSRNGITYTAPNLEKAAHTLRNKPILKDHNNEVDSIVGRTTEEVHFSPHNGEVTFEGHIMDKGIQEKIKQGLITNVSVGAIANIVTIESDEGDDQIKEARDIEFVELSLTPVPGVKNASITHAIAEAYNPTVTSKVTITGKPKPNKEEKQMTENKELQEMKKALEEERKALEAQKKSFEQEKINELVEKITNYGKWSKEDLKVFSEEQLRKLLVKEQEEAEKEEAEAKAEAEKEEAEAPKEEPKEEKVNKAKVSTEQVKKLSLTKEFNNKTGKLMIYNGEAYDPHKWRAF